MVSNKARHLSHFFNSRRRILWFLVLSVSPSPCLSVSAAFCFLSLCSRLSPLCSAMRSFPCTLLSRCVLAASLLLLISSSTLAAGARLGSSLLRLNPSAPALTAATAYAIQNYKWINCNSSLPVQVDDVTQSIVQGDVQFLLVRFHTEVAIQSAYFIENVTLTPAGGGLSSSLSVTVGMESFLLSPASLPIAAGSSNVLLSNTQPNNRQPGHYQEHVQFFDAYQNAIACVQDQYDVVQI